MLTINIPISWREEFPPGLNINYFGRLLWWPHRSEKYFSYLLIFWLINICGCSKSKKRLQSVSSAHTAKWKVNSNGDFLDEIFVFLKSPFNKNRPTPTRRTRRQIGRFYDKNAENGVMMYLGLAYHATIKYLTLK